MKLRYLVWGVAILALAGFAVVMIPGSPYSLQNTVGDPLAPDIPLSEVDKVGDPKSYPQRPLRQWTADLSSPDRDVRLKALYAIDRIAPLSERAALPVAKLVQSDPDKDVKEKASHVLYRIGMGAKPALDIATAALADDNAAVRRNAVLFMMTLKTEARSAVPGLIKAMNDPRNVETVGHNETIQQVAAATLGGVSTGTGEAVQALTDVVTSNRPVPLRTVAARALGMIGAPAKSSVPALTTLLASVDKNDLDAREDITVALRSLGENPPDIVRPKTVYPSDYGQGSGVAPSIAGGSKKGDGKKSGPPKKGGPDGKAGPPPGPAEKAPPPQEKKGG